MIPRHLPSLVLTTSLSLGVLTSGCSSSMSVTRYDPAQDLQGAGVVYFLPKTELQLRFNVELSAHPGESCARILDDCESIVEPGDLRLTGVELIGITLPDDKAGFVLESKGTVVTETEFTATLDETGQLLATNAITSDQTLETLTWGVDTLSKIFQTAVMAGASELKSTQQLALRRDQILKAIRIANEQVEEVLQEGDPSAVLRTKPVLEALYVELAEVEAELKETISLPVVCSISPASDLMADVGDKGTQVFVIDPNKAMTCPEYAHIKAWLGGSGLTQAPLLPTLSLEMTPQASMERTYSADDQWYRLTKAVGVAGTGTVAGVVYRVPAWFEVSVVSDQGPLLKETLAIPQLGRLAALTVKSEAMRRNRTLQISLHPGLGSLNEVHYALSPMDLEAAKTLTDTVLDTPNRKAQIQAAQAQAEIDRINAQLSLMAAQQELDEALKAIEEAKAAEEGGAPATDEAPSP